MVQFAQNTGYWSFLQWIMRKQIKPPGLQCLFHLLHILDISLVAFLLLELAHILCYWCSKVFIEKKKKSVLNRNKLYKTYLVLVFISTVWRYSLVLLNTLTPWRTVFFMEWPKLLWLPGLCLTFSFVVLTISTLMFGFLFESSLWVLCITLSSVFIGAI